jgi:Fe2+ or Zn2+ uptake regulation protein
MGDGTRVEASPKREKASSRLKCPALHQSLSEQNVALEQGGNYLISLMRTAAIVHRIPFPARTPYFDTNVSDHHHFFFEDTGRLLDIPGELAVSGLPKPPAGATIRRIDVIIRVDRNPAPAAD